MVSLRLVFLVFSISNLHFGPEVGVGKPKSDAPVVGAWLAEVEKVAGDLRQVSGQAHPPAEVFFADARHLAAHRAVLRPGARLAYVVGDQASYLRVMIRTGQLLAELADALGYEVVRTDLFRTRFATATQEQLRETEKPLPPALGH